MTSLEKAPASVRGWAAAEKSADPIEARRALLSPDAVFEMGPFSSRGVEAVLEQLALRMPAGWLGGEAEWSLQPASAKELVKIRGTGPAGAPMQIRVPGDGTLREWVDYVEFTFALDDRGLITSILAGARFFEAATLAHPLRPGDAAPDFVLPDVAGAKIPLRLEGTKATVVVFISNHCPYALGWHDRLQKVGRDYAARGVRLLQINASDPAASGPEENIERSRKRVAEGQFAGPYLIDAGQTTARRWGARHTPEAFILNAQGLVAYHGAPDADSSDESQNARWLRGALDCILGGAVPDPAETVPVGCTIKWAP